MEFYKRTYYKHEKELARYEDGQSIFIAFDPFSKQSILYRAKPVAKESRQKFLFQFPMSIHNDQLSDLCHHLSAISLKPRDDTAVFIVVSSTQQNGKRRLVIKSDPSYGNLVLSYQKAKEKIPDQEPTFDDNAGFIDLSDGDDETSTGIPYLEFEDEKFAQFQFRQADKLGSIVKRLRTYIQQLVTNKVVSSQLCTEEKKKEKTKGKREKKQTGGGKKRVKKIETSEDEVEETLITTPPGVNGLPPANSSYCPMPSYGNEEDESTNLGMVSFTDEEAKLDKSYVMLHLNFFVHLYNIKNRYLEATDGLNIDCIDIVRENKAFFESVDADVSLKFLEDNQENVNHILDIMCDILNDAKIDLDTEEEI